MTELNGQFRRFIGNVSFAPCYIRYVARTS